MITKLAHIFFWFTSIAAFISARTLMSHLSWLPSWAASILALLVGAVFGIAMVECFVRLHGIKQLFEQEPINGATGAQITFLDLFMPYIQIGLLIVFLAPVFIKARKRNGLDIPTVPDWAIYLPAIIMLVMVLAFVWSRMVTKRQS